MTITYYDILEVSPKATQSVISAAYRALSQKYHPDKNNGDKDYEEKMAAVNVAYGVLSDSIKRKLYDQELEHRNNQSSSTSPQPTSPKKDEVKEEEIQDVWIKQANSSGDSYIRYIVAGVLFALVVVLTIYPIIQQNNDEKIKAQAQAKYNADEYKKSVMWSDSEALLTGFNSVQNYQKALNGYEEIARGNLFDDKRAEQRLAEIYFFGLGQQKDYIKALEWYQKVNNNESLFMIGMIYFKGLGVKKDWIMAYYYFNIVQSGQYLFRKVENNPLIQNEQSKLVYDDEVGKIVDPSFNRYGSFYEQARIRKDFLNKELTTEEINKAQNLEVK
jgi:curved DNA-binding protein CbpA